MIRPRKVLVVEDSKLVQMMYDVMLQYWPLVHANDGLEALEKLDQHADVEVILLDVNMPRMNGLEFLANVKASARFANIPVVIVSTEGKDDIESRAIKTGAAAFIKKPFRAEAILEVLSRVTGGEA